MREMPIHGRDWLSSAQLYLYTF